MIPDFEITVRANIDPANGLIAEGAAGGPAVVDDFAHVRNWIRGMLYSMEGNLPPGWSLDIVALAETGGQREISGDPRRPSALSVVPDRLALIETATCAACDGMLRRDTPDGVWYHVQLCADATPIAVITADG